jgi:hypothetical protein
LISNHQMICKKSLITSIFKHPFNLNKKLFLFAGIAFLFLVPVSLSAQQQQDTVQTQLRKDTVSHSPTKAALYSAILPGLGQVYNKRYWKLPIIYGGLGFLGYSIGNAQFEYMRYRKEYVHRVLNMDERNDPLLTRIETRELPTRADDYRKMRDVLVIGTVAVYLLQVIDASVDAHLFTFDVSDDLSINFQPDFNYSAFTGQATGGIALRIKF